jgi:hypothetical protein
MEEGEEGMRVGGKEGKRNEGKEGRRGRRGRRRGKEEGKEGGKEEGERSTTQHFFREDIEAAVSDLVDWLLKKNSKQWNNVMEFIDMRTKNSQHQLMGKISTQFDYNRKGILKGMEGGKRRREGGGRAEGRGRGRKEGEMLTIFRLRFFQI